jgi:uncharacterized protein YxeA
MKVVKLEDNYTKQEKEDMQARVESAKKCILIAWNENNNKVEYSLVNMTNQEIIAYLEIAKFLVIDDLVQEGMESREI